MGVTFEDMVRKSMRMYWLKTDEYNSLTSNKSRKYDKTYFDGMEKDMLAAKDQSQVAIKKVK